MSLMDVSSQALDQAERASGPANGLGTTMFFGHNGEGETLRYLADSGLRVRDSSVEKQNRGSLVYVG